jgi:hypothetical protein
MTDGRAEHSMARTDEAGHAALAVGAEGDSH